MTWRGRLPLVIALGLCATLVSAQEHTHPSGTTLPATCRVGSQFVKTTGAAGLKVYLCESADTWVLQSTAGALPTYTTAGLPAAPPVGYAAVVTDGGASGALVLGDGANWNCNAAKAQKLLVVTCPPYNAKGDGATDDRAALNTANTAAGTTGTLVFPKGTYKVSSALVLSAAVAFQNGAILSPDTGITVTLSGPLSTGPYKIFTTGAGTISLAGAPITQILPQWWGAIGDGGTDSQPAIQAAIDAAPGAAQFANARPVVYIPAGYYKVNSPLLVTARGLRIFGAGRATATQGGTTLEQGGSEYFPLLYYVKPAQRVDLTYGAALVTGAGASLAVAAAGYSSATYVDFNEANFASINGLSTFTAECFIKWTSALGGTLSRHVLSSYGLRSLTEGGSRSFGIESWTDGSLHTFLTLAGTQYSTNTALGTIVANTTYHVALTYDGATIRVFVNGVLAASSAHTGTITAPSYENGNIGALRTYYPYSGATQEPIDGLMDSIRLSSIARYTAPFTPSTSKLTSDANTLFLENFDNEVTDFSKVTTDHGTVWIMKAYNSKSSIPNQELGYLELRGKKGPAIFARGTTGSYWHDLDLGGLYGFAGLGDNYESAWERVGVETGARLGISVVSGGQLVSFRDLLVKADHGIIIGDGSSALFDNVIFALDRSDGITIHGGSTASLRRVTFSHEGNVDATFAADLILDGTSASIRDTQFEASVNNVAPIWIDASTYYVTLEDSVFYAAAATPELIKILSPIVGMNPVVSTRNVAITVPSVPLSLSLIGTQSLTLTNTATYAAIANTSAESYFAIAANGKLPAGRLNGIGRRVDCGFAGVYSTTGNPTLQLKIKLCTISGCGSGTVVTVADTGAVTIPVPTTNAGWVIRTSSNVFTAGASGTLETQGWGQFGSGLGLAVPLALTNITTQAVNTTVDQYLSQSAQWSVASPSNTAQLRNLGCRIE